MEWLWFRRADVLEELHVVGIQGTVNKNEFLLLTLMVRFSGALYKLITRICALAYIRDGS